MSITKILLLLFFIWLGWKIYKFYKRYQNFKKILEQSIKEQHPLSVPSALCQCAHCGVHLPEKEALFDGQTPYCCIEHKQAGSTIS